MITVIFRPYRINMKYFYKSLSNILMKCKNRVLCQSFHHELSPACCWKNQIFMVNIVQIKRFGFQGRFVTFLL